MIGWGFNGSYGMDSVTPTNAPFAEGKYQTLITDTGDISQEKQMQTMRGYFKKLVSGDSIQLSYKIDRNDSWTDGTAETTADKKETRLTLPTKGNRFNEYQAQVTISTTNENSPEFYGLAWEISDLNSEKRV